MPFRLVWTVAIVLCLACPAWALPSEARQVRRNGAQRLVDLLVPGETRLTVIEIIDPPHRLSPDPGSSLLDYTFGLADAVVVIEVAQKVSTITPSGDWIHSAVTALVLETFKASPETPTVPGQVISFTEEGGSVRVGDTEIVAAVPGVRALEVQRRYLMFLTIADGTILTDPEWIFEIADATRLRGLNVRDSANRGKDDITNSFHDDVAVRMRGLALDNANNLRRRR